MPNGKYAPPLIGLDNKRVYEAMLTGRSKCRCSPTSTNARRQGPSSATSMPCTSDPPMAVWRSAASDPKEVWAWIVGLGGLVCCHLDRSQGGESQMSDDTSHGQPSTEVAIVDEERYPVPDPGLEEHLPRLTDVDENAADRATRQVATFFGLPILCIGFVVVYFAVPGDAVDWSTASQQQKPPPRPDVRPCTAFPRHGRCAVGPEADGRRGNDRLPAQRSIQR